MNSPLTRVILSTLGGFLVILFILEAFDWFKEEFPEPAEIPEDREQIRYPFHRAKAEDALKRFALLSNSEQSAIKRNLETNLITLEQWILLLDRSPYEIFCIGELHEEATRKFLANQFFAKVSADSLLLETTPDQLQNFIKRMNSGRSYFPMLEADILNVLRAVRGRNAEVRLYGIEETQKQQKGQHSGLNSREQSIARNFWDHYRPGKKHFILFGALHCAKEPGWLFDNLQEQASPLLKEKMLSVAVFGKHQKGSLEAFKFFVQEIGISVEAFVITESNKLHPFIIDAFGLTNNQAFEKYDALVVYNSALLDR